MFKTLITASLVTFSSSIFAFTPASGMVLKCYDSVSNYTYKMTLVDLGDETAQIEVFNHYGKKIENHKQAAFNEHSSGSFFLTYKNDQEYFSINFNNNDLFDAYYEDRGDSRAVDCHIIEN